MQQPPPRQRGSSALSAAFSFEAKLQDEEHLLDQMLAAMPRGALPPDAWEKLHAAAQRDDRLSELAFAFESVSQGKRLKVMQPSAAAEFLFQAARYLADVFGDELGAIAYLERALSLAPLHAASFEKIETLLIKQNQPLKLAETYATAAQHRPRSEQAGWLRRATNLLGQTATADERVVELLQQLLRLEPGDEDARLHLEGLYVKANRLRDVVRLNEQALASEPPPDGPTRVQLLARIVDLYENKLHEPERAMPHIEQLLALEPAHEEARRVAQKLLVVRGLAGRAAAALSTAAEAFGTPQEIARYLAIELDNTRGPKRAALLARLGRLRHERMADDAGAFEALEQAIALDSTDDAVREQYVQLAARLARWSDAAKSLGRVLAAAKDAASKAKASTQMGEMLLRAGDAKRARATLAGVVGAADAPPEVALAAARLLREILEVERDRRALCDVLEMLASLEPDAAARQEANERLADEAAKLPDVPRAIGAYERLLETSARARALDALEPLYKASADPEKRARLLEERARDTADDTTAREVLMRAAQVRAAETKDAAAAIATCRAVVVRFGPATDVLAILVPLLEGERRWPELAEALALEAALTTGAEHAQIMARLGTLRMARLRDVPGAIDAYDEALAFDPFEKTARTTLEKLAALGDHRLAAARVLEPLYRREGATGPLLKVLELRGTLSPELDDRLDALRETADLAVEAGAGEATRAVDAVGRGLAEAVAGGRPLREWLNRLDAIAGAGTDPKRRATILARAVGDHEITSDDLSALAKEAAEALAASGEVQPSIALYRRALAFEPQSQELLSRIDDLLRNQGNPQDRVALYRAAIARRGTEGRSGEPTAGGRDAYRRELLHRIGAIEWRDLGDLEAAVATYGTALADDPDDAEAYTALAELYAQRESWSELCALLDAHATRAEGDEARSTRARLAEVAAAHGDDHRARVQCARLLEDPQLLPEHLDAVERAAERLDDADLARAVLHRRTEMTQDPREQIAWLDRLASLDEERRGDLEGAAAAWKRGAALAESIGDDDTARRLFARARKVAPEDPELTARLAALCERAELWSDLPRLYAWLAEHSADDAQRVDLWLRAAQVLAERLGDPQGAARRAALAFGVAPTRPDVLASFERLSVEAGAGGDFELAVDEVLARIDQDAASDPEDRACLLLAKSRAVAADPHRADDAARTCRALLADPRLGRAHHAEVLATLDARIAADPESPARRADHRWLLEWRAEHAPADQRLAKMLEWARAEEAEFSDPARALAIFRRVLALDADCDEALAAVARLALATGEVDEGLDALRAHRDRAEAAARAGIDLEIARALLARTTRWQEALVALQAVLADTPADAEARALAAQLLAQKATRAGAIAMLEQACEATDDAEARAQILQRLIDAPADAEDAHARREWFGRLCDLERGEGNTEKALATAMRAARELPDVSALWDRAEALARSLGRPDEVAALYEEVLAWQLTREQMLSIGERAVQFYEEWFEDSARVARILERVLEVDPSADWAFDRLKLLLDAAERWDDLFALYDRALASASGKKRTMLLEDAAQTAKDFADRPDRAIQYLEQLHEGNPGDAKLAGSLERLYERQGRYRELVSLLTGRLPALRRDEGRRTRTRIAALWLDELGDAASALDTIEPAIPGDGDDSSGADAAESWAVLERVLASTPPAPEAGRTSGAPSANGSRSARSRRRRTEPPASSPASVRQRAAALLREHYARTGRDADLARVLLVELEAVKAPGERIPRHLAIADLYEKSGDPASALEQVGLAIVLDPGDEARRDRLAQLTEQTGRLERFAELLSAAAEVCEDGALRIALTMQAAAVRADRMGDASGAVTLLGAVLAAPDATPEDTLAAARRLDPLLESSGRSEERLDILERIAGLEEGTGRRDALGQAARLSTQLGQFPRAIESWEKRLADDAQDADALDGLADLLERVARHERLAEVLALRARVAPNRERERADRVRRARLLAEVLNRRNDAVVAWREVEHDFGEADDAALALAELLRDGERWGELASLLERRARNASDDATRAELLRQLGDVQRGPMREDAAAVATYAGALAADPRNAAARAGLLALAHDDALRRAAIGALLIALRACDDWQGVLELTSHRLQAADGTQEKLAVLLEAAELAESRGGDTGLAFEAVRRAFALAPGDAAIGQQLARLAEASGAWQGLVDSYREAIASAHDDPALAAALRAKAAVVLETRLDDPHGALAAYLDVVRDTTDLAAAHAAVRLAAGAIARWEIAARVVTDVVRSRTEVLEELVLGYEAAAGSSGAWDEAARALADATQAAGLSGEAARDLEARVAAWHRDRRADPDAAEAAFRRALSHDEANPALLANLAELQRRTRGRPLVDSLVRLSRATGGDFALLREAIEVACEAIGDRALARAILEELLSLARARWTGESESGAVSLGDPSGLASCAEWGVETLARLLEEGGDERAVVDALVAGASLPFDRTVRRGMQRRGARIALELLGDHERAIELYLALFADDPHDEEAVDRLATTYAAQGRTRALLELRERQLAAASDLTKRAALRLDLARLHIELGDRSRAAETLRATLAEDARNRETVEALASSLAADGRAHEQRELLTDQARLAEEAGDAAWAADLWSRAAALVEERFGDADSAQEYHARVVALEPRAGSLDALARLAAARDDAATAAAWLERLVEVVPAEQRIDAIVRLSDALTSAGNAPRAVERLERALAEHPDADLVRARLAALYREQGQWSLLAQLLGDAAAHAPDKATRMASLLEAATLLADRCNQPDLAVSLLEQASDLAPDDAAVRLRLADALARARRFDDARGILQAMIAAFGGRRPKERAPVHYQIARLELAMGNRARALVELDTATRVDPQNPEILRALAQLARDDGQLDRAERSYRALLLVLRRKEDAAEGGRGIARSDVLLELSAIARQQGETERASEILESALEAASRTEFEQEALERTLRARNDDETLVRVLEAKLARVGESAATSGTLAELATVLADRLQRPGQALAVRLRAVAADPGSAAVHEAALALARAMGATNRYVDATSSLVDRAIDAGDLPLACALLVRLGGVAEEDLKDGARSARLLERAVDLGLRSPEVLRALDRAYERLGDTASQARVLSMRIEVEALEAGRRAAGDAMYRLAALRLSSRETLDEGVEILQTAIDLDPQLERAEEALRAAVAIDPTHLRVLELYETVGRKPGHERALVDALRLRAQRPNGGVETVREAVEVAMRIGDPALAESLLERFVAGEESVSQNGANLAWAMAALGDLREAAGDVRRAVDLKRSAAKVADPEIARKLAFEVARLAAERLDDLELAAAMYEALHTADPADREAWEPLAGVYRRLGQWRKLVDLLAEVVDRVDAASERARLRLERVRVLVQELGVGDADAIPLLREIVDEDAGHPEAALMLASILERTGGRSELATLLARQIDSAKDRGDAGAVASLCLRLGRLLGETDRAEARNVYYTGLDWDAKNPELLGALLALLDDDADSGERADLAERRLAVEQGPGAEDMALSLYAIRTEIGDERGAERALELGFRAHPASAAVRDRLESAYLAKGEWRKLAELWVVDASARVDLDERIALLRKAGTLWRSRLDDPKNAAAVLRRAREMAPDDATLLRDYVDMLVEAGDREGALAELNAAIERVPEGDRRRAPLLAARAQLRTAAGDAGGSLADLEQAFSLEEPVYAGALAAQLEAARNAAREAGDAASSRAVALRLAHVLPYTGEVGTARTILIELVKQDTKDVPALRAMADLESRLGHWDAAIAVLRRLVALEDGPQIVATALRLSHACEVAGRPGDARGALERARTIAPDNGALRARLESLYERTGAWRELANVALEDARESGDVAERFARLVRAGSILLERAAEPAAAVAPLEEAHALRPADPDCVGLLADALTLCDRAQESVALLEQAIAPSKGRRSRELAPLYLRLARAARHTEDSAGELRALGYALDCDSQNGAVCADVAARALELEQFDLANRALRAVTLLKEPGPLSKAIAYLQMGEIARRQSDPKRALALLKRALMEDPTLEDARAMVDAMERGLST